MAAEDTPLLPERQQQVPVLSKVHASSASKEKLSSWKHVAGFSLAVALTLAVLAACGDFTNGIEFIFTDPKHNLGNREREAIYRIIGDDLPPYHQLGQARWNLEEILRNEPHFPGVAKRYILNHITNWDEENKIKDTLKSHGVQDEDILQIPLKLGEVDEHDTDERLLKILQDVNRARNKAIQNGKDRANQWIFVLDGNSYITEDAWAGMKRSASEADATGKKYLLIGFFREYRRMSDAEDRQSLDSLLSKPGLLPYMGEPQIAFRSDSTQEFNENKEYGDSDKLDLLLRIPDGQIQCHDELRKALKDDMDVDALTEALFTDHKAAIDTAEERLAYNKEVLHKCGAVIRMWGYPTQDAESVLSDWNVRAKLRDEAMEKAVQELRNRIVAYKESLQQ